MIEVRDPKKVADTIQGVVKYLKSRQGDGKHLSQVSKRHRIQNIYYFLVLL